MHFDFSALSLPSVRRKPLFAAQGVVATSQALASQAGFSILKCGGNAVDAILPHEACTRWISSGAVCLTSTVMAARTTAGSNWVPAQRCNSASASAGARAAW